MNDWKKHGWKFFVLAVLFGIVGTMDYEDQTQSEVASKAYYDDLKQQYGRTYVAVGETNEHH